MGNIRCFIALYCVVSLSASVGVPRVKSSDRLVEEIVRSPHRRRAPTSKYDPSVVSSIELSTEPPWSGTSIINNITKEIDVLSGERLEETSSVKDFLEKYFDAIPRNRLEFHGRGIASYKKNWKGGPGAFYRTLEIIPLRPGTYSFEYGYKGRDLPRRVWTVRSVPTYTVRPGSFFELELNFTEAKLENHARLANLENLGVKVDPGRGTLLIYGLANDIRNGTIVKLRTSSLDTAVSTIKIRLLLKELKKSGGACRTKVVTCVKNVQVWMRSFDTTIQNRESFAECLTARLGWKKSSLTAVRFEDYGGDAKSFEAQPLYKFNCRPERLHLIFRQIRETCFPGVIGYQITCSSGGEAIDLPPVPVPHSSTTTELSDAIDSSSLEAAIGSEHVDTPSSATLKCLADRFNVHFVYFILVLAMSTPM